MIIDTSVVIAVTERRSPTAITAIGALGNKSIRSFVVEAELIAGLEAARRSQMDPADITMRESTLNTYYDLSERPVSLPLDVLAAAFGQVTGACSSHHLRLGQNDRWILAEALSLDESVLTADARMHEVGNMLTTSLNRHTPLTTLVA